MIRPSLNMDVNITLIETGDFFEGLFTNPMANWTMLAVYLLGIVSCMGLALASWFERSGQAGPFRTLLNQLVSFNNDLMIIGFLAFAMNVARAFMGPIPWSICFMGEVLRCFCPIAVSLTTLCITVTRFTLVFVFKAIPVMDDSFLARAMFLTINMISVLASMTKFFVEDRNVILMNICTGQWRFDELSRTTIPMAPIFFMISFMCTLGLSIPLSIRKSNIQEQPFNHQQATITNFGTLITSWMILIPFFLQALVIGPLLHMDVTEVNSSKGIILNLMTTSVIPFYGAFSLFIYFLVSKKHFFRAFKQIFFPVQIHPVLE